MSKTDCFKACYDSGYDAWSGKRWCNYVAIGSGNEAQGYWCYVYQNCDNDANGPSYDVYQCPLRTWDPQNDAVPGEDRRRLYHYSIEPPPPP